MTDFPPPRRCVFPLGDPDAPDFDFCRAPVREDPPSPYCAEHHAVAYYRLVPQLKKVQR